MRHLVIGGAGFLGSHLFDSLIKDNQDVIYLDTFHDMHNNYIKKCKNAGRI